MLPDFLYLVFVFFSVDQYSMMMSQYVDIHSHLNDKRYADDLPEVLARMREAGVASIVVGTDREMSERAIALAQEHGDLWATIGQHPTDKHEEEFDEEWYRTQVKHPRVVAIGECGLDYYWPTENTRHPKVQSDSSSLRGGVSLDFDQEKRRQHDLFERQIAIAQKIGKPLMIHGRPSKGTMDAYEDILAMLRRHPDVRGNVHFFVGNIDIAKQFLDFGFTMSFTGVLTFTHDYDEVVRYIPPDRMMSETDAPYVAPAPHRGKRNEPAFVIETVKAVARIKGENEEMVCEVLAKNVQEQFFKKKSPTEAGEG